MITEIQTIPELLVKTRGNQTAVSRILGVDRITVAKYARDRDATEHAVVNGTLMVISMRKDKG